MTILTETKRWRRNDPPEFERTRRVLSQDEQANVRLGVEFLCVKLGGREAVAAEMRFSSDALHKASGTRRPQSMRLAIMVAYVGGTTIDDVLSGVRPGDECPWCGRG